MSPVPPSGHSKSCARRPTYILDVCLPVVETLKQTGNTGFPRVRVCKTKNFP